MNPAKRPSISFTRRHFLRASGITLGLPLLESLAPRGLRAAEGGMPGFKSDGVPRRMVCICNNLGLYPPNFIPQGVGRDYKASRYLKVIRPPHSPTPVPVLSVSGAADAKANS